MARGHDRVAAETQSRQERQKQFEQSGNKVWLDEGQAVVFRFLEQGPDVFNFLRHPYKILVKGKQQTRFFTCLNDNNDGTPCPGCDALEGKVRGVYCVIQRDRPKYRKGADGKAVRDNTGNFIVDGNEDAVVYWDVGSITAETLRQMDADYGGLMSRDFKVSRTSGSSFQPYVFTPADPSVGEVPMSPADQQLAQNKPNLDEVMAAPSYAEASKIVASQQGMQGGGQAPPPPQPGQVATQPADPANPFVGGEGQQPPTTQPPAEQSAAEAAPATPPQTHQ